MSHLDNWSKFRLLFLKNWEIQLNHKWALVFQLVVPLVLLQVAILLLHQTAKTIKRNEMHFPVMDLTQLTLETRNESDTLSAKNMRPLPVLLYSPNTSSIIDMIVKNAAESLQLSYDGYASAEKLTEALRSGNFLVGAQFNDVQDYPQKLSFDLRFPSQLRTSKNRETWMTTRLFPAPIYSGPRNADDADGGYPVGYLREGFLPIQHAISMAYLKLANEQVSLPEVQIQRYPYPPWVRDHFVHMSGKELTAVTLFSFMYPCICITKYINSEKENQLKEIMKIMGLQNWIHWAAWFLLSFLLLMVSVVFIVLVVKFEWIVNSPLLNNCNFGVLFFFLSMYLVNSICACFMIATFFQKASTAAAVFGLLWLLAHMPYEFLTRTNDQRSLAHFLFWCLASNTAMGLGFTIIVGYEKTGEGLQWSNISTPVSLDDSLTFGYILLMMLVSSVLYLSICLYVEQVFPGKYGVPRKWNFPLLALRFCGKKKENEVEMVMRIEKYIGSENTHISKSLRHPNSFEAEPVGKIVGIKIQNLEKKYGNKTAIKNLSINIYQDEITVLLGHKGSGKTTITSMLTGMFPPTSGSAYVNGCEIFANKAGARMYVGICPDHNVFFNDLSMASNIKFFSQLKGLKGKAIDNEVVKYLMLTELSVDPNATASHLSVGMKRMITICCALCGGSKVVIFDEPSLGMNPLERKQFWQLLQAEKSERTLLLTTHLMNEADVLSDRIAIICNGDLKCYGTSFFLKKKYGYGYILTCVKDDHCNIDNVTTLLRQYIPGLQPTIIAGKEFSYQLSDKYSADFEKMLADLENHSNSLKLKGFGISINSMSDVFSKVGAEKLKRVTTTKQEDNFSDDDLEFIEPKGAFAKNRHLLWGFELCLNHWKAMFFKKFLYTLRKKLLFLTHITFPLYFIVVVISLARLEKFDDELPSMTMSLTQYPDSVMILEQDIKLQNMPQDAIEVKIADQYKKIANAFTFKSTGKSSFSEYILKLGKKIQSQIDKKYLAAATVQEGKIIAWLNNALLHTAPLTLNLVHNAMAKALIRPDAEIVVTNAPLPFKPNEEYDRMVNGHSLGSDLALIICVTMCLVSALYTLFLIEERACRSKLMQFVCGVQVWTFWLTQLIWDMMIFTITALLIVLVIACFREPHFLNFAELGRYFLVIMLFGLSMLPLMYLFSLLFTDPATGFTCICIINFFGGIVTFAISNHLFVSGYEGINKFLNAIFRAYPHFSLVMALNKLYTNTATHNVCESSVLASLSSSQRCMIIPQCCDLIPYFARTSPGICFEVVNMILTAIIFFSIIIVLEYGWIGYYIRYRLRKRKIPAEDFVSMDDDVWMEKESIDAMTKFERIGENLVLDRISKFYKHNLAVNQVSLCVKRMECIGLLGVDGAGKSSLMKMMTGDERITHGNAHVRGYSVKRHLRKIYTLIGYCPQNNPLLDELTGREHLKIICLLRGIHKKRISHVSEGLAKSIGFMKHLDKKTKDYSISNKRKLSTALAVIGKPVVIFLDEPTLDMDPAGRHQLWDFLGHIRDSGMSIVLISHNMEECEALCNRLAIMVNGEIKCMGTSHHLKNKFSKTLTLKIKVRVNPDYLRQVTSERLMHEEKLALEMSERKIKKVIEFVIYQYTQAVLKEEHYGVLTFHIPLRGIKWSQIFGLLENNQMALDIEDYTISQTTLEDIFLEIAKKQGNTSVSRETY